MAGRVAYFGLDEIWRTRVLAFDGYQVEKCRNSVPKLHWALRESATDAVAISESGFPFARRIATLTRSLSSASLILFEPANKKFDEAIFDAVIPCYSPPSDWLARISKAIDDNRAVRQNSARLRANAEAIRQQAMILRRAAALERKRFLQEQMRASSNIVANRAYSLGDKHQLITTEMLKLESKIYNLQYLLAQPSLSEEQKQRLKVALSEAENRIREILPFY